MFINYLFIYFHFKGWDIFIPANLLASLTLQSLILRKFGSPERTESAILLKSILESCAGMRVVVDPCKLGCFMRGTLGGGKEWSFIQPSAPEPKLFVRCYAELWGRAKSLHRPCLQDT